MNTEDYADYIPTDPRKTPAASASPRPLATKRRQATDLRDTAHDTGEPGSRPALATRALLWATLAICMALVVATASETWQRVGIERQTAQTRAQNSAMQRDTQQTQHATTIAQSPDTIEREARNWGYIRPGDTPVIIIPTSSAH